MLMTYSGVKEHGTTVTLDGHGADELFSGYGHLIEALWDSKFNLKTDVETDELAHVFYKNGVRPILLEPQQNIDCDWDEVPRCTEVVIDVRAE